jgi:hypothetical protein
MAGMRNGLRFLAVLGALALHGALAAQALPAAIRRELPPGFDVQTFAASEVGGRQFTIVALRSLGEAADEADALPRPLLIFARKGRGDFVLLARNDHVILRRDAGGASGCDPFEDGRIAVKGAYFTVEHGIACGQHWTWFVTFRFDRRGGQFVFDNLRSESWSLNPSDDPDAEALVSDGQQIERARPPLVPFADWRPRS